MAKRLNGLTLLSEFLSGGYLLGKLHFI